MNIKFIVIFVVLIITSLYLSYLLTYSYRTDTKIKSFESKFIKNIDRRQKDLCGEKYKNNTVSDFFICSSHNPFLTGFLKYDYSSLDMMKKCIIYGSRYIELEIMNNEIKNDTIPVVGSGNIEGSMLYSQNIITCQKVFDAIGNIAFSEKYLDNYREPFFIFLNLKLNNNLETLNKLYDIIQNSIGHRLLDHTFSREKKNIAQTKMCHLMDKIVIFSSAGYEHSNMEDIINMSTNSSYLKRIKYDELPHDMELSSKKDIPLISLSSKKIKLTQNLLYILDDTNLLQLGMKPDMVVKINGCINPENNTQGGILKIIQVTQNTVVFEPTRQFKDESEENKISLDIFNLDYTLKNIDKQNNSSITIVYTDNEFFNFNYDPENAWNLGCQFVCMNFQKIDLNLKKYMTKFKKYSILLKPSNLRFIERSQDTPNLNSLYPKYIENNSTDIIRDFARTFFEISLVPFKYLENTGCCVNKTSSNIICSNYNTSQSKCDSKEMCEYSNDINKCKKDIVKVIYINDFMSVSPNSTSSNSRFEIVNGLDNTFQSISFKYGNKYMVSNSGCCFLSFKAIQNSGEFRSHASFFPVKPLCNNSKFISFMQLKNNKKYYIKYRKELNINERLYKTDVSSFNFVGELNSKNGKIGIYEPKISNNYKCIGHIFVRGDHKNVINSRKTILLKGAVSDPIGFELLWNYNNIHIWNPIPADGYIGLGVIVTTNKNQPKKELYCCVAIEYTREIDLGDTIYWSNKGNDIRYKLGIWETPNKNYYIINKGFSKPSEFAQPIYTLNFDEPDRLDKLYIGSVKSTELESACFKIINIKIPESKIYNRVDFGEYTSKNNYKLIVYDSNNNKKCIGLNYSYWSKFYYNLPSIEQQINLVDCRSNDYFGTNFITNEDGTIRLKDSNKYCLENRENKLLLSECRQSKEQKFNYDKGNNNLVSLLDNTCLGYNGSVIEFSKCNINRFSEQSEEYEESEEYELPDTSRRQDIHIFQDILTNCIEINSVVYIKKNIKRSRDSYFSKREDNTILINVLNEDIDRVNFHIYVKGVVIDIEDNTFKIRLFDKRGSVVYLPRDTTTIIPDFIPSNNTLIKGVSILVKNGGVMGMYNEENVRWKANIVKKLDNNKFSVIFSINSIEADYNKSSIGRPRTNEQKIIDILDIILLKHAIHC